MAAQGWAGHSPLYLRTGGNKLATQSQVLAGPMLLFLQGAGEGLWVLAGHSLFKVLKPRDRQTHPPAPWETCV